ncbi:MAG TPA: hypothetical protein VEY07_00655 [Thermoplasmata archaeon]|nr:hypothetical protein [Thermoplasmata archaeon]
MVDPADLEVNVLEFLHKSFWFERLATVGDTEFAVFHRRETESESKLRPKLIRLFVVVPRAQVTLDVDEGLLRIAPDGTNAGPRHPGEAREAAADASEFSEQGIDWRREKVPLGFAYLPKDRTAGLRDPAHLAVLGLA